MAETAANEAAQRYAAIEQAYSKENWTTVLQDGEELLLLLRQSENPQLMGLQMRLQLLLGHTQLYGYSDKAAASGYYGAVAEQSSEAALTKIATQGLKQCAVEEPPSEEATAEAPVEAPTEAVTKVVDPIEVPPGPAAPWITAATTTAQQISTAPSTAADPVEAEAQPPGETSASTPAAPWSEPSLIPEVVEEPELIELHQADPSLAEDVELAWKEPVSATPTVDQTDADLVSGLMLVQIG